MEFFDVLHMRQSVRRYTGEKVEERDIAAIVEAAQLAPVGMHNNKGYVLTVISSKTVLDQMKRSFTEVTGKEGDPSYGAPLFILVSKTPEAIEEIAKYDAACIVENMHLAAAALGLGSVYIHGMIFPFVEKKPGSMQRDFPMERFRFAAWLLGTVRRNSMHGRQKKHFRQYM